MQGTSFFQISGMVTTCILTHCTNKTLANLILPVDIPLEHLNYWTQEFGQAYAILVDEDAAETKQNNKGNY